jgi:hypothetical protein
VLLQIVATLPNLKDLIIRESLVTDEFLAGLPATIPLTYLELSGSRIGDAGLQYLARFATLEHLVLDRTEITDAGLMQLQSLRRLTQLSVQDGRITPVGAAHFKLACPNCQVAYQ